MAVPRGRDAWRAGSGDADPSSVRDAAAGAPGGYPPRVPAHPAADPPGSVPAAEGHAAAVPLRRNDAYLRLWAAATVSVFGSFVTRIALPFVAILALDARPAEVALLRAVDLVAALLVGLVAGAWVDRLRRRPVMIWADLGRAALLATIPAGALGGWLSLPQVFAVSGLTAILTTFFDVADRAYLPTVVDRADLVRANAALTATGSAVEFAAFGSAGILVARLTAPIAIALDAVSFVVSAVFLASIRRREPPPPPAAARAPVLVEIREGLAAVRHDPALLGLAWGSMGLAAMWGVFGATWLLFANRTLRLDPAAVGIIAALGGLGSLAGAVVAASTTRRLGVGPAAVAAIVVAAVGNALTPLAPAGAPVIAIAFLLGQQLVGDTAVTLFDVTAVSVRQARVDDRRLGRVNATFRVAAALAQLAGTLVAGLVAEAADLRTAAWLAPAFALAGAVALARSPLRPVRTADLPRTPVDAA